MRILNKLHYFYTLFCSRGEQDREIDRKRERERETEKERENQMETRRERETYRRSQTDKHPEKKIKNIVREICKFPAALAFLCFPSKSNSIRGNLYISL